MNANVKAADGSGVPAVTIVGGGLNFAAHLSVEACQALRRSRTVLRSYCPASVDAWLRGLAPEARFVDIDETFYMEGQYRPGMYREMARIVVEHARQHPPVTLIEPGSPIVTDLVTSYTLRLAREAGLTTRLVAGISCLELVLDWLELDPSSGLQVAIAQEFVGRHMSFNRYLHAIILQPGYYDTLWSFERINNGAERFAALKKCLEASYRPADAMAIIRFPMAPGDRTHCLWFHLEDIEAIYDVLTPLHTLFVPAQEQLQPDLPFYDRIQSWRISQSFVSAEGMPSPATKSNAELEEMAERLPDHVVVASRALAGRWRETVLQRNAARVDIRAPDSSTAGSGRDRVKIPEETNG